MASSSDGSPTCLSEARFLRGELCQLSFRLVSSLRIVTAYFFAVGTSPPTSRHASTNPSTARSRPLPSDSASTIQASIPRYVFVSSGLSLLFFDASRRVSFVRDLYVANSGRRASMGSSGTVGVDEASEGTQ